MTSTIDVKEVEKFSRIADEWWDEGGKFKPLHKFNPVRISFIKTEILNYFSLNNLCELKILDVGCGGGLVAEPFARMGAEVTAIDASEKNIAVAKIHAEKSGLKIDYRNIAAENLDEKFDVVLALEIIEHVADIEEFIKACSKLIKPNGLLFIATINRTAKSFALAKVAVEYILRWLPHGTHDWEKFLKPSEIFIDAEKNGLNLKVMRGFGYNIFKDSWEESENVNVNYIMVFSKT